MNRHESRDAGQDLRTEPGLADLLKSGRALKRNGQIEQAFNAFNRAVELDADSAEAWKALAQILADLDRHHEAALSFQHVLKLDPSDDDAAYLAGFSLFKSGRLEEALALLDRSSHMRPNQASTAQMRALALKELARPDEALAEIRRAHALDPTRADICNDVGSILLRLRRHEEALGWLDKAVALQPEFRLAHKNRGYALSRLRRFDEAFAVYAALKAADPGDMEPDWSVALLQLMLGDFEAGWAGREVRWSVPSLPIARHNFPQSPWLGKEPIAGKTILIYQDEGLGDVIQFMRYVPDVAALGARVLLLADGPLIPLLSKMPEIAECIPRSANRSVTFDTHCAISSLPLVFGTRLETIPADVPYLPRPDEGRINAWEQRLGPRHKLRVGLVWSGNRRHMDNSNRSLPLRALLPLLDGEATFVSLQKETSAEDQATLRERPDIVDLTVHLTDFTETAALMSCLDLIITVDTSMAHLAGALGRPTWIMLQHMPDWRWLLDREDCPWYPTARLFRQTEPGNFTDVVARVRHELAGRIAKWSRAKSRELVTLGTELKRQGLLEEAFHALNRAVELDVESAETWKALAQLLADLGRSQEASLSFQHVLKLDPSNADAAYQAGLLQFRSDKMGEALALLSIAKELRPDHVPTLRRHALALASLGRLDEAAAEMARAHALDPSNADICNSMGVFLRRLGRPEEALIWLDKALTNRPDSRALLNKGSALERLHRFDEALAIYAAIKAADPGNAEADWNTALLQLLRGNFEAGWAGREARWKAPELAIARYDFRQPMWLGGEPIAGKTILIYQDEGLGDVIQFVRYVPDVAALGARVVLVVDSPLVPLLSKLPGVAACIPAVGTVTLAFDVHCGISSLPLAFGTRLDTIPARVPYLPPPDAARVLAWQQRLGPHHRLRVGLVWSGNPKHGDDRNRSLPLRALSPLLGLDATFVSLQKDPRPADRPTLFEQTGIVDLTVQLTDFVETAALVSCLDLVITVDTSMAHLAGALACPTWILLPYTPDWRWLLDRDDSPWYPTVRLFRQDESCDYAPVIDRMRSELSARITEWHARAPAAPDREVALSPEELASAIETGFAQMRAGRHAEAEAIARRVLSLFPDHADSLHLMGLLALHRQQLDDAVEFLSQAIRRDPKPLYLTSLGTTLLGQGRREEAVQVFDKAVQLRPDDAELWQDLGVALVEAGRPDQAILVLEQALKLNSRYWDAAYRLALLLFQAERHQEALACFDVCADMQPDHFPTVYMRALALHSLRRFEEALAGHQCALTLDPASADTCQNMGNTLRALFRQEEAIAWYDRSLMLRPGSATVLGNKAVALAELRRFDEAIAVYHQAIAADPGHAVAEWNLALLQLLRGDFEAGWTRQEARWQTASLSTGYPAFCQPKWLGAEPIMGKTVIAYANEGVGDAIHFVRYVPMLAARGAQVILVVHDQLCTLLSRVEGVARCLPRSASPLPDSDFHVPFSSLPLAFGTRLDTIPADTPYVLAPPARVQVWEQRLGAHDRLRVGLVWSGNPKHNNDRNRSLPLHLLAPLLDLDASFVSLQKDPRPEDRAFLGEHRQIVDLTADLADFTETAALISCLDLVISVDTSVAHLAGALACPTWILLPHTPDYRWLLDRDDCPWYPTARLFRQTEPGNYADVIGRVRNELSRRIAARVQG